VFFWRGAQVAQERREVADHECGEQECPDRIGSQADSDRRPGGRWPKSARKLRAACVVQAPLGLRGDAGAGLGRPASALPEGITDGSVRGRGAREWASTLAVVVSRHPGLVVLTSQTDMTEAVLSGTSMATTGLCNSADGSKLDRSFRRLMLMYIEMKRGLHSARPGVR
jgi:hypothetical protein